MVAIGSSTARERRRMRGGLVDAAGWTTVGGIGGRNGRFPRTGSTEGGEWRGAGGVAMDWGAGEVTKRTVVLGDGWRVVLGAPREAARERRGGGDTPVVLTVVSDQPVGVHLHRLPVEFVSNSDVFLPGVQV